MLIGAAILTHVGGPAATFDEASAQVRNYAALHDLPPVAERPAGRDSVVRSRPEQDRAARNRPQAGDRTLRRDNPTLNRQHAPCCDLGSGDCERRARRVSDAATRSAGEDDIGQRVIARLDIELLTAPDRLY